VHIRGLDPAPVEAGTAREQVKLGAQDAIASSPLPSWSDK